jgi:hypothetical protein
MLELKKILHYIPYELKYSDSDGNYKGIRTASLGTMDWLLSSGKPILRPMSDLAKEITVNGQTFVPIEWFEIGDDVNNCKEYDHGNRKLCRSLESLSNNVFINDIDYLPHGVIEKLFEWHFDIYGLIEQCLAIDINTLNK